MERDERDESDAVRLAVSGEPLPEGAEGDPDVRAALADVEILREQLAFIATAVAGPAPAPEGPPRPRRRRALRRALAVVAAVAVLGVLGTAGAYLVAHNGRLDEGMESAKLTPEGLVACATDIAEGTVTRVERLGGDEGLRVTLSVERRYKEGAEGEAEKEARTAGTAAGESRLVFTAGDVPVEEPGGGSYFRVGTRMLVVVSRFPGEGPLTYRQGDPPPRDSGEDVGAVRDGLEYGRAWVEKALPGSAGADCPHPG
ncbi:hypothetical protein AB0M38_35455 [Streptomyces sp. NPDC051742]|uniref:hypothetical protein n=1 Tax=unclassified Streptomyces TaxID=2593676 RepID=UPI00344AEEC4